MPDQTYRFAAVEDGDTAVDLSSDPRLALLAVSIANQQRAGFKHYLDLREVTCPDCGAAGFNSGWGTWDFTCGAARHGDGEVADPCPKEAVDHA